jgi:hypothetical protein
LVGVLTGVLAPWIVASVFLMVAALITMKIGVVLGVMVLFGQFAMYATVGAAAGCVFRHKGAAIGASYLINSVIIVVSSFLWRLVLLLLAPGMVEQVVEHITYIGAYSLLTVSAYFVCKRSVERRLGVVARP